MTKKEISELPTLCDVIELCCHEEYLADKAIINNPKFRYFLPTHEVKGYYQPVRMKDGKHILMPLSPSQFVFYRGQSKYHEKCYPSLYRKGMGEAEIFVERIKRVEMELMMQEYPITNLFANTFQLKDPSGNYHSINFRIGYDGMAQHYGIKTEYFDLTTDIWTAAFFAATTYNYETDTYSPIIDTDNNEVGVFYVCNKFPPISDINFRIDVVGMQPLLRPGRQFAYVYRMYQGENFNDIAHKIFFRHDADVNNYIYNRTNQGKQLFPKETLSSKIHTEIVKAICFSKKAIDEACNRYYPNLTHDALKRLLDSNKISINSENKIWFTESEKEEALTYWETVKKSISEKIRIQWVFKGPIEIVTE